MKTVTHREKDVGGLVFLRPWFAERCEQQVIGEQRDARRHRRKNCQKVFDSFNAFFNRRELPHLTKLNLTVSKTID